MADLAKDADTLSGCVFTNQITEFVRKVTF